MPKNISEEYEITGKQKKIYLLLTIICFSNIPIWLGNHR